MICPMCGCDWWNEICINCRINIYEYEHDSCYKEKVDKERIDRLSTLKRKKKINLPINYNECTQQERRLVREEYIKLQRGLCYHCGNKLDDLPHKSVRSLSVDNSLFPPAFFKSPIHLHHSHETGMTIGAVHCYCNAILWQYHGE